MYFQDERTRFPRKGEICKKWLRRSEFLLSILSSNLVWMTLGLVVILLISIPLMLSVLCSLLSVWMISADASKSSDYIRFHSKSLCSNHSQIGEFHLTPENHLYHPLLPENDMNKKVIARGAPPGA